MTKYIFLFLTILIGNTGIAQDSNNPKIDEYKIESEVFGDTRSVSVSTPVGYNAKDKNTSYLVAYLFDGQFTPYFSMVNSVIQYYSQVGDGVPMIVISIHTKQRSVEFTPKAIHEETTKGWDGNCGNAGKLTQYIREEVIPQVESKYNVKPYRLAIGHSLGGTYVLTELFKKNSLFKGAIAASPNMVYDKEQIVEQGKTFMEKNPKTNAFVYCAAGNEGKMENNFRKSLEKLNVYALKNMDFNMCCMDWKYDFMTGATHMRTFLPTFDEGYLRFSKNWIMTETRSDLIAKSDTPLEGFLGYYEGISAFAGFENLPNNNDYNNFAYTLDYFKKYEDAIIVLDKAITLFPNDANLHDSKGEMLEKSGDEKAANASFKMAIKTLEANKENYDEENFTYYSEMFKKNVDRTSGE